MSVNNEDIDFKKAFEKSAGPAKPVVKKNEVKQEDVDFSKAFETSVKKKDTGKPSVKPSEELPDGDAAVPGTTSTTKPPITNWNDNPLNPVKAAKDFDATVDKTPEILFKTDDQQKLNSLLTKHKIAPASTEIEQPYVLNPASQFITPRAKAPMEVAYEDATNLETDLTSQLADLKSARIEKREPKSPYEKQIEDDIQEAQKLKRKAFNELAVNGEKEVEVLSRQDDSGNSFKRTMQDMFGSKPGSWQTDKPAIEDKMAKMPKQFLTGVNILKGTEPAMYERVTDAIAKGLPISQSETAQITNLGLNLEQAKLQRDILKSPVTPQEREQVTAVNKTLSDLKSQLDTYEKLIKNKLPLDADEVQDYKSKIQQYNSTVTQYKPLIDKVNTIDGAFSKRANEIQEAKMKNLVDNPEVFRAFISSGVAEKLDEIGKIKQSANTTLEGRVGGFMLGHTWNYSPEQIKWASEQYLKEQGFDYNTPQAKAAIKFLQDNEGVMIGENSIAKAGGIRELGMGAIEPIEGISKYIDDKTRSANDVYAESQSQGNVQVARKRLEAEDTGVRSVLNDVLKGTGQFATQAAIMAATSGAIGTVAESIMGKAGVQLLADAKAANLKTAIPFDDATAHIATGKFLTSIKNPVSVFTTSYAMAYDGNLKAALSYTSDNDLAKRAASFNAAMEGATELFLSPLEIAEGIIHKFSKNQTKDILKILSDKSLKNDPSALKEYVGKFVKGVLGTSKVAGAEIGEEFVTQISDYVTNMYLNPESDSFKNRNLNQELMTTAYQTGLSMAVPALMNGIGAGRANSFSKGSLMVAAQNRLAMVDDINKSVAQGTLSQTEANQRIQLITTAAVANSQLPKKANGAELNTNEKANYIWSRTTEAYMEKQMASTADAAAKEIWKDKILKQQEYRKGIVGLTDEQPEVPEYTIDDKPVSREELLQTAEAEPDNHNFVATNDEEAQAAIRKIGGIDDKVEETIPEPEAQIPSDKELVKSVEEKAVPGYEKTSITELKEQALQAPASFKNQFDDEELTVNLIAKNTPEQIENAIKYQQERIENDPNMDEVSLEGIDQHIQLLEKGLEKNKQFAELEEKSAELEKEGKPLSKLETLKAKKKLAEVEVPGETVDEKLKHIADNPEGFAPELVALAEKRFPKEVTEETKTGSPTDTKPTDVVVDAEQSDKGAEPLVWTKQEGRGKTINGRDWIEPVTEWWNNAKEKINKAIQSLGVDRDSGGNWLNAVSEEKGKVASKSYSSNGKDTGTLHLYTNGEWAFEKRDGTTIRFDKDGNEIQSGKNVVVDEGVVDKPSIETVAKKVFERSDLSKQEKEFFADNVATVNAEVKKIASSQNLNWGDFKKEDNKKGEVWNNKGTEFNKSDNEVSFTAKDGNKYLISHSEHPIFFKRDLNSTEDSKGITVEVKNDAGEVVGSASFENNGDGSYSIAMGAKVESKIKRVGVARAIYDYVDSNIGKIKKTNSTTLDGTNLWSSNSKEQSLSTKPEIALNNIEGTTKALENKLPEFQNNTRTQATKDLIKWAEDIFNTKFEGDFDKGEYVNFFNSLGDKGYEAARFLQNPKKALSILKESPTYQAKVKEHPTKPEIKNEEAKPVKKVSAIQKLKDKRVQKKSQGNTEVFSALDEAAQSKKSMREKDIAMEKEAERFGVDGKAALFINRNFDNIVSHLKSNNKIQVQCP